MKIKIITLVSILCISFTIIASQDTTCAKIQKNLKQASNFLKNDRETLESNVDLAQELNEITNGFLIKAMMGSMKLTFMFAPEKAKKTVSAFFSERFTIDLNRSYDFEPAAATNLDDVLQSFNETYSAITNQVKIDSNAEIKAIKAQVAEITNYKGQDDNIDALEQTALVAANQEAEIAGLKAKVLLAEDHLNILEDMSKEQGCK